MTLTKGTVFGIVSRLEDADYVKKVKHNEDKRTTYVIFSYKGKEFAKEYRDVMSNSFKPVFKNFSDEEMIETKKNLLKLREKFKEEKQMNKILIIAITTISLALVFYTIGVWSERKANTLKKWHVITFWLGLLFDTVGTLTMERIARSGVETTSPLSASIHGVTGVLAIALMVFHAIWATFVIIKNDEKKKQSFHRLSIVVWSLWLIPYFIGMIIGIIK